MKTTNKLNRIHVRSGTLKGLFSVLTVGTFLLLFTSCSDRISSVGDDDDVSGQVQLKVNNPGIGSSAKPEKIPGQYIIVLEDHVQDVPGIARGLIQAFGGDIIHTYQRTLKGFAVTKLPEQALAGLQRNPHVKSVHQDFTATIRSHTSQLSAPWGLDRIDQRDLPLNDIYNYENNGTGVWIYVVDTGVRTTHEEFGDRASQPYDAFPDLAEDCRGHGTHVAGIAAGSTYGVAKGATIISVRVAECDGMFNASRVIDSIEWITTTHPPGVRGVVNLSFGWPVEAGSADTPVETAVKNSITAGLFYAGATDNARIEACGDFPSRIAELMTVGRTNNLDRKVRNTGFGPCVDIFAPGQDITSAWSSSNDATVTTSGTSMATPHVAGVAALHRQANPGWTPAQVMTRILSDATVGRIGTDTSGEVLPTGTPDRLLFAFQDLTTSTSVSSSPNPSVFGQNVTFTSNVTSNVNNNAVTDGSVNFISSGTCDSPGTTLASNISLNSNGQAVFNINTLSVGNYTITACFGNHTDPSFGAIQHRVNAVQTTTVLQIDPTTRQYSDLITLSADVTPKTVLDQSPAGQVLFQLQEGASWTTVASANLVNGAASREVQVTNPAGIATYRAVFNSTNSNFSGSTSTSKNLSVTREDALITYSLDNHAAVEVSSAGGNLNVGELVFTIEVQENEITSAMAAPGNISNAGLSVKLIPVGPGSEVDLNCVSSVSGSGYSAVKNFTCSNPVSLEVNTYEVEVNVTGDYYTAPSHYDAVTVYDPSLGFVTGGGTFILDGDRVNFGFVMRYNPAGRNLRGNLLFVRHHQNGKVSRLKSNSLGALAIGENEFEQMGWASFDGRSTYSMWNEGKNKYDNVGNQQFRVYAEDRNSNGSGPDRIWIKGPGFFEMPGSLGQASANTENLNGGKISVPLPGNPKL